MRETQEELVRFGAKNHLTGTLARPSAQAPRPVAFLMLNAGVIHRIGPRRFNVKLARVLAGQGFVSLRLDLSGQGDSLRADGTLSYEDQVCQDLQAAMDAVQQACGIRRFVVAGICSGAVAGLRTALADPRIAGLWMLDGPAFATRRSTLVRLWQQWRWQPLHSVKGWLKRLLPSPGPTASGTAAPPAVADARALWTIDTFAGALASLHARGLQLYLVYTGDMLWQYSYERQFRDTFKGHGFVDHVRCELMREADHTLTTLAVQQEVIARIVAWATPLW